MQYIFEIIIPQCHHKSFFPNNWRWVWRVPLHSGLPFTKAAVLILLWGDLSPGNDSKAPTELAGLPLDLEMGEPCKGSRYKAFTVQSSLVAICPGTIRQPFTKTMLIPTYFQVKIVSILQLTSHTFPLSVFLCAQPPPETGSPTKEGILAKRGRGSENLF